MTQTGPGGFTPTAPPPGVGGTENQDLIGVPSDYKKAGEDDLGFYIDEHGRRRPGLPAGPYHSGAEWAPQSLGAQQVLELQVHLVQAGVLSKTKVRPGIWDNASAEAYRTVLAFANANEIAAADALQALLTSPQLQKQAAGRASAVTQLTNPIDIKTELQSTAQSLTGKELPAAASNDFVGYYQQQERNARAQLHQADLSGGGVYTDPPSVSAAAQDYIKQHNLTDVVAYGTASRMLEFQQMLRGI